MELYPIDEGRTRLVSRVRVHFNPGWSMASLPVLDPGQFIMERKWLKGVKKRAERAHYMPEEIPSETEKAGRVAA